MNRMSRDQRGPHRIAVLLSMALLSGTAALASQPASTPSPAAKTAQVEFNIKAQKLSSALLKFSEQAGIQVLTSTDALTDLEAPAVRGRMAPNDALAKLLQGTNLKFHSVGGNAIAIGNPKAQAGLDMQLKLASVGSAGGAEGVGRDSDNAREAQQVVVKDRRIEPFQSTNADIPRTEDDVQPYYIFDSETLMRSGAPNLETFLKQRLTMNTIAMTGSQNMGGNGDLAPTTRITMGNTSSIDLRGLGTDKTLILVNGRRLAGVTTTSDSTGQTDINGIPLNAIDRIEVMPSSASGIYGGNAIGGVINVVLKSSYQGGEIRLGYDNSWSSNSARRTGSAVYGMALEGGRTQLMATGQWSQTDPMVLGSRREIYDRNVQTLRAGQPSWFNSSTIPFVGAQSNIASGSGATAGPLTFKDSFGGGSLGAAFTSVGAGLSPDATPEEVRAVLLANAGSYNEELPDSTQYPTGLRRLVGAAPEVRSLHLSVRRDMTSRIEAFLDFTTTRNDSEAVWNPFMDMTNVIIQPTAAANPFTRSVRVMFPNTLDTASQAHSTVRGLTAGVKVRLPLDWVSQLEYTRSESSYRNRYYRLNTTLVQQHLLTGEFNPFVDVNLYPMDLEQYLMSMSYSGSSVTNDVVLRGSGPVFSLPWGKPRLTFAVQHNSNRTPPKREVWQDAWYADYYAREQSTLSGYAETLIPLVAPGRIPGIRTLELQLSGRAEQFTVDTGTYWRQVFHQLTPPRIVYSGPTRDGEPVFMQDTYGSSNYTVGFKYQPIADLTVRASHATAFLPPGPNQLTDDPDPKPTGAYVFTDPGNPSHVAGYVPAITGGNPGLLPQTSKSFNAGVIWQPSAQSLKGLRLNLEYYRIKQINAIITPSQFVVLGSPQVYADRITRDANGQLTQLDLRAMNQYARDTAGLDFSVDYQSALPRGTLDMRLSVSNIRTLRNQYDAVLPAHEAAGYSPAEGGSPDYKSAFMLNWNYQQLSMGWVTSFVSSYKQYGAAGGPASTESFGGREYNYIILGQGSDTIPKQMYHDLTLSYRFGSARGGVGAVLSDSTLTGGVRNLFDKVPPYDANYRATYFVSPYGDLRLRSYWLNFARHF